ncbi:hypothetical protein D6D04_07998, partial [Aureobasidium pullulans]
VPPLYKPSSTKHPSPLAVNRFFALITFAIYLKGSSLPPPKASLGCTFTPMLFAMRLLVPPRSPRILRIIFRLLTEIQPALSEAADRRKSKGHIGANPIIIVTVPISYSISSIIRSDRLAICLS